MCEEATCAPGAAGEARTRPDAPPAAALSISVLRAAPAADVKAAALTGPSFTALLRRGRG